MCPVRNTEIPGTVLIVGTDASGKDHVANILADMISEDGGNVEKRKRYLNGTRTTSGSSTGKSSVELFLENGFIRSFPFFGFLMPFAMRLLLQRDLAAFAGTDGNLIVVGHNCLRGLAFYWGHRYLTTERIPLSTSLRRTLERMRRISNMHTVVLDVEDEIRKRRVRERVEKGDADYFDVYMAADGERSERIEHFLVWLCVTYLGATLIQNNDLDESALRSALRSGFHAGVAPAQEPGSCLSISRACG